MWLVVEERGSAMVGKRCGKTAVRLRNRGSICLVDGYVVCPSSRPVMLCVVFIVVQSSLRRKKVEAI